MKNDTLAHIGVLHGEAMNVVQNRLHVLGKILMSFTTVTACMGQLNGGSNWFARCMHSQEILSDQEPGLGDKENC